MSALPAISIVLPVYNAENFLQETIDSLLNQTFQNFELIILNDGSTDRTKEIIQTYDDQRIKLINHEVNQGLIYTLNQGLDLAAGEYVARMDADDICKKDRLQKQFNWLEKNKDIDVLGCKVCLIDDSGREIGEWQLDGATTSYQEIKKQMIWQNCLAHPTVMMRKKSIDTYRYNPSQLNTEDYDFWLRILANGLIIQKLPEPLLQYRVHNASITGSILRKTNPFFKQFNCKRRFLVGRIRYQKWAFFETKVLFTMLYDGLMGTGKHLKKFIGN